MYMTAGHLVDRVAGRSWEDYTRERIFKPLGMKRSNFSVDESQRDDDFSLPYQEVDGRMHAIPFHRVSTGIGPSGSINSSAEEMVPSPRFLIEFVANGLEAKVVETGSRADPDL